MSNGGTDEMIGNNVDIDSIGKKIEFVTHCIKQLQPQNALFSR